MATFQEIARQLSIKPNIVACCAKQSNAPTLSANCFWLWRLSRRLIKREKAKERARLYAFENREDVLRKARERYAKKRADGTYVPQVLSADQKQRAKAYKKERDNKLRLSGHPRRTKASEQRAWFATEKGQIRRVIGTARRRARRCVLGECKFFMTDHSRAVSKERNRTYFRVYLKNKRANDIQFLMRCRLRTTLAGALRKQRLPKHSPLKELIGCTWAEFLMHIESLFQPGMTWENRHLWELDHVVPLAAHDLTCLDGQKAAANYRNIQPLWTKENRRKSSRHEGVNYRKPTSVTDRSRRNSSSLSNASA